MITSKQRAYLRGLGASCPAIMQVGKGGVSENLIKTVSDALEARELVKLSVLDNCEDSPREVLDKLVLADLLADGALVAIEGGTEVIDEGGLGPFEVQKSTRYGSKTFLLILLYRKDKSNE